MELEQITYSFTGRYSTMKRIVWVLTAIVAVVFIVLIVNQVTTGQGKVFTLLTHRLIADDSIRVGGPFIGNGSWSSTPITIASGTTLTNPDGALFYDTR